MVLCRWQETLKTDKFCRIEEFNKANDKIPIRHDYAEKKDRSTHYSFNAPFQLAHADFANLEFLGKSAMTPKCALLLVDLY